VRAIYAAKGRPATNPLIVHVPSVEAARDLCAEWPSAAQKLADAFWPGPLTLVLPRTAQVPDEVTAGGPTVAVRVPAHPAALSLLQLLSAPVAAPSANRSEHVSPTSAAHVLADLSGRIDAVLDGGDCAIGIESTVVSLAHGAPRLLRAGGLSRAAIEAVIGPLAAPLASTAGSFVHASPGQHARHYAPAGTVRLEPGARIAAALREIDAWGGVKCGVILRGEATPAPALAAVARLPGDLSGYARGLYAALRSLEEQGCAALVLEEVPEGSEWEAVRDRLQRAAG
jgi:L-threonylcarbamoyladenylate synthase